MIQRLAGGGWGGSVDRIALFLFPRHLIPSGKVDTIKKSVQRRIREIRVTSFVLPSSLHFPILYPIF